ncbi:MAG: DUF5801 repeats-in-toxin domain-containing protein [Hyphomicrobiaceae bacterium]
MAIRVKKPTVFTFAELCRYNKAPVLRSDSNWVKEDGPLKATGNVLKALSHPGAPFGKFADRADVDPNGDTLKVTTTGTFFGKYGILKIKANGSYVYKLYTEAQKPGAFDKVQGLSEGERLKEVFRYNATDGFVTRKSLLSITIFGTDDPVKILDLTPASEGGDTVVDEDGLPGALADSGLPGEVNGGGLTTNTGDFKISAPDGVDDLIVGGVAVITNGVFGGPVSITTPLGNTLTILSYSAATGVVTYSYTLNAAETHPGPGEDSIFESLTVTLSDVDGSTASASLDVRIVDDQPTIAVCETQNEEVLLVSLIVDECVECEDGCVPPDTLILDETDLTVDATSNFAGAFVTDFGADGPGSIVYALETSGGTSGLIDTLSGLPVVVAKEGDDIIGRIGPAPTDIVFVISIDPLTGDVTFDQQRAVVHDPNFGPNDFAGLPFDLVSIVATITDSDGDTASATFFAGGFFGIFDDAPTATDEPVQNVGEGGTVAGQFDFAPGNDGATVTAINGTLLVFGPDGFSQDIDLGLGTIKVKADGSYEFTADNPTNSPVPPINGTFTVTDGDGDPVTGNFTFQIDDVNVPTGGTAMAAVDDDGLSEGNPFSTSGDLDANVGDDPADTSEASFTGVLGGSVGGDVPGTFSFAALHGTSVTVGLETVNLTWAGNVLTGTGPRGPLFEVVVTDPATGAYQVHLLDNVLHAGGPNDEEINATVNLGYVITDSDGSTAPGTLTIVFDDDAPSVVDDTDSIASGAYGPATGNVLTGIDIAGGDANATDGAADSLGADGGSVTAIIGFGGPGTIGGTTTGQYGILTLNADGSYSYTRNPGTSGGVTDTFTYTVTDGDGDTATATLAIDIGDAIPVTAENATVLLDDDALGGNPGGTDDDPDSANATGFLAGSGGDAPLTWALQTTGAPGGFSYIANGTGIDIFQGTTKVLVVTLNAATGGYTVSQVAPIAHVAGSDENNQSFTLSYTVTDADTDVANGTLDINVDDDTPVVANDTDSIASGAYGPATGNVLTGIDIAGGDANATDGAADSLGADGGSVTAIIGFGGPGTIGGTTTGQYGILTLNADGSYSYTRNPGTSGGVTDTFTYTVTDGDGDTATATLAIDIGDAIPVTAENATVLLDDDALGGNPGGTDDDPDSANATGFLAGSGGDGPLTWTIISFTSPIGFGVTVVNPGLLEIVQGVTLVMSITLDNATGAYTVTQHAPIDHAALLDENNTNFTLGYRVTDADGDIASGSIQINVDDDTPVVANDTDSIASGAYGPATGNVLTGIDIAGGDANATDGAADSLGADGGSVTAIIGFGGPGTIGGTTTGQYGILTLNADGSYSYTRNPGTSGGVTDTFTYTVTDGDGDTATATLAIDIGDAIPVTAENATVLLDDDALGGNPGGTDDDPDLGQRHRLPRGLGRRCAVDLGVADDGSARRLLLYRQRYGDRHLPRHDEGSGRDPQRCDGRLHREPGRADCACGGL